MHLSPTFAAKLPRTRTASPEIAHPGTLIVARPMPWCRAQFEGFCEALCRLAVLKALPTDAEIEEAGCQDAGHYMLELKRRDERAYTGFLHERATRWGDEPRQPSDRCLGHLITVVIRRIEAITAGKDNLDLTPAEVDQWVEKYIYAPGHMARIR